MLLSLLILLGNAPFCAININGTSCQQEVIKIENVSFVNLHLMQTLIVKDFANLSAIKTTGERVLNKADLSLYEVMLMRGKSRQHSF